MNNPTDPSSFPLQTVKRITDLENNWRNLDATRGSPIQSTGWVQTSQWTRTGNYTFTFPTDVSTVYRVGTKVRYTLPGAGAYEYGVVATVSFDGITTTTITLVTNSDYAMTATPDLMWYSHIENPEGWPGWFDYTPTFAASGSMTISNLIITYARWRASGRTGQIIISATLDLGGTASGAVTATVPSGLGSATAGVVGAANCRDAASGIALVGQVTVGPTVLTWRKYDATNWTLGATRTVLGSVIFPI